MDQGGALGVGHAQEVARLVVRQHSIYSLVPNDNALLVIILAGIGRHIASGSMHRLRVGLAGLQLWCLADGDVAGLVGHEILSAAGAMNAELNKEKVLDEREN